MDVIQAKVCIIGAGPAGIITSLFLQKYGISTILLEKEVFPRDKICGDGISGWVVDVLELLDEDLLRRFHQQNFAVPSYGMRFSSPNGTEIDIPFLQKRKIPEIPPGYIAPRKEFDNFFITEIKDRAQHIKLIENQNVIDVHIDNDGALVKTQNGMKIKSEIVVLAAGAKQDFQSKFSSYKMHDSNVMLGLKTYYKGITGLHPKNYIELHFIKALSPGYLWIFPQADGVSNVGVGISKETLHKEKINLKKVLLDAIETNPILKNRFKNAQLIAPFEAHPLPLYYKKMPLSGNRFLLAGDSAGLIDPFTGEGIGHAALMGMFAAQTIKEAIRKDSFNADILIQYDNLLYRKIDKELNISKKLPKILKYNWLFNKAMKSVAKSPKLQHKLALTMSNLDERKKLNNIWHYIKHLFA